MAELPDQPVGFLDGQWVPATEMTVPVWDAGFVWGASLVDQMRTFQQQLPLLDLHLERLFRGLQQLQIELPHDHPTLAGIIRQLVEHNLRFAPADNQELGVCTVITPGDVPRLLPTADAGPADATVRDWRQPRALLHTYALDSGRWNEARQRGLRLLTSKIAQVTSAGWPVSIKTRSRVHYWLAEQEIRQRDPAALPLLLNTAGEIAEGSTGSVLAFDAIGRRVTAPPTDSILDSISLACVLSMLSGGLPGSVDAMTRTAMTRTAMNGTGVNGTGPAEFADVEIRREPMTLAQLKSADEVLWTSSTCFVLPVGAIDGCRIGAGSPGPLYQFLARSIDRLC